MATLTVFTPTFNNRNTLQRAYASLERQTSRDFEWLVVDDGSSDDTQSLVATFSRTAGFEIDYVRQENAGKHTAHNLAVARARTELLTVLDADDELLPSAVETLTGAWKRMAAEERTRIAGIWTLAQTPDGRLCGDAFPADVIDTSLQAMWFRHHCTGERLPCFTTAVLRDHLFPQTQAGACPFIPEAYVWFAITRRYDIRFLNVVCRIYHPGGDLMNLARNEYRMSRCIVYGYARALAHDLEWFGHAPATFFVSAIQTARYALFGGQLRKIARDLPWQGRALVFMMLPVALLILARDYASGRIARSLRAQEYKAARDPLREPRDGKIA